MRRSHAFLSFLGALVFVGGLMFLHAAFARRALAPALLERGRLVGELGLTDLCLSTEANYTRHLSQADPATAFQDHPLALEHFPSGTWMRPSLRTGFGNAQRNRPAEKHP